MTDIPIIFSAAMIQALLAGTKTMTRRFAWRELDGGTRETAIHNPAFYKPSPWQRVKTGDRLWVREGLALGATSNAWKYRADDTLISMEWPDHRVAQMVAWAHHQERETVPSIHMPRWASRLTLVVTATKIERLQAISNQDAMAEGAKYFPNIAICPQSRENRWSMEDPSSTDHCLSSPYWAFANFWNKLHGDRAWEVNPEVVAMMLIVHRINIDAMKEAA